MIAGFNTDIEHNGVVYHVQTEDKGLPSRMILSLVYDRGTILASKRATYEDLDVAGIDEKKLAERVGRQHKLICAAIRSGRVKELQEMTARAASQPAAVSGVTVAETVVPLPAAPVEIEPPGIETQEFDAPEVIAAAEQAAEVIAPEPIVEPLDQSTATAPPEAGSDELILEPVAVVEDEVLADDAVVVMTELSGRERPTHARLAIELLGDTKFKAGDRKTVTVMVSRGSEQKLVDGAQIMIKILGSSFRPVIFHAMSDANGLARVHLQVPRFQAGRAALLVRAISDGEEIELRRAVSPTVN